MFVTYIVYVLHSYSYGRFVLDMLIDKLSDMYFMYKYYVKLNIHDINKPELIRISECSN